MTEINLPEIDISQFQQEIEGDHIQYHAELAKVREACKEWGFFRVVNHGIAPELLQKVVSVTQDLLSMPAEVKDRVTTSNPAESYIRLPDFDVFCFMGMPNTDSIQEMCEKIWPEGNSNFCEAIGALSLFLSDLRTKIIKSILASLGLDATKFYKSDFEKCKANLHINGYSSHGKCMGDVVLPCHADVECLTILYNDGNTGLQVRSKQGKWFNIKSQPDSFIVNIGDCFQAWTNGRYRSPDHRVVYTGWRNRISLPFSIIFPHDAQIWAPVELVDDDDPRRYKPFTYSALLKEISSYQGYQADAETPKGIERIAVI
ncbi:hypothetical protein KI387_012265 [Taxus chinensis]|uniref:Fe2OG dioxygenase domain-containing protein n=1 Tax=Taxus chinensis TaxID=29808 RepID=A0AA38CNK2_TAXCH|nr:hypothetical protein KI387_012265 [Taxus chinensis]